MEYELFEVVENDTSSYFVFRTSTEGKIYISSEFKFLYNAQRYVKECLAMFDQMNKRGE